MQHVVHQNCGVGQNYALDRAVRDVALVPKSDIFKGSRGIGSYHTRKAAYLLARNRIAFVRHSRAAALLAAEWFLYFADFGALQVANFQRDAFERRRHDRERGKIFGMTI